MTDSKVYESLVEGGLQRVESASEAAYRDAWTEHSFPREPDLLAMATSGGLIADRVAWVFVAGYQAACRHVFPSAVLRSWVSYAATEDRETDPPLPGVRLTGTPSAGTLSGNKAWIAAARSVGQLVVRVGTGPTLEETLDQKIFAVGTAEDVAEQITWYDEQIGLENLLLFPGMPGDAYEEVEEQLGRLASDVLPQARLIGAPKRPT